MNISTNFAQTAENQTTNSTEKSCENRKYIVHMLQKIYIVSHTFFYVGSYK